MKLNIQLTFEDFLEYQLYSSSKSKNQNKNRLISRIIIPIIYLFISIFYFIDGGFKTGIIFLLIAAIWYFLYPFYSSWHYKRHFRKHIEENYKNRINKIVEITIGENSLFTKENISESKISSNDLKSLIELKNHFFVKLSTDVSLIIPKKYIENQSKFKEILIGYGTEYVDETNWNWN